MHFPEKSSKLVKTVVIINAIITIVLLVFAVLYLLAEVEPQLRNFDRPEYYEAENASAEDQFEGTVEFSKARVDEDIQKILNKWKLTTSHPKDIEITTEQEDLTENSISTTEDDSANDQLNKKVEISTVRLDEDIEQLLNKWQLATSHLRDMEKIIEQEELEENPISFTEDQPVNSDDIDTLLKNILIDDSDNLDYEQILADITTSGGEDYNYYDGY